MAKIIKREFIGTLIVGIIITTFLTGCTNTREKVILGEGIEMIEFHANRKDSDAVEENEIMIVSEEVLDAVLLEEEK